MASKVIELLNARYASRAIREEKLDPAIVDELIEAARMPPSCFNNQPWRFLFLESDGARAKGAEAFSKGNQPWASRAPLIVVGYSKAEDDCQIPDGREYHQFDLGMSVMSLILTATENDLVARPMAGFKPDTIKEAFGLADEEKPLVMLAIGKKDADESHVPEEKRNMDDKPRTRKSADEIVRRL